MNSSKNINQFDLVGLAIDSKDLKKKTRQEIFDYVNILYIVWQIVLKCYYKCFFVVDCFYIAKVKYEIKQILSCSENHSIGLKRQE